MADVGIIIFLLFIAVALFMAARAAMRNKKKRKEIAKRKYRPYQPQTSSNRGEHTGSNRTTSYYSSNQQRGYQASSSESQTLDQRRSAPANADEYYRAGMYDRAKDEYLKTGRIFGAAKSVASKGKDSITDALEIINRYAPEREEEMVRNLSRYFFDSGEVELSARVLYEFGFKEESNAVLATIGKSFEDIIEQPPPQPSIKLQPETVKESEIVSSEPIQDKRTTTEIYKELASISTDSSDEPIETFEQTVVEEEPKARKIKPQPLKIATTDIEENCIVCMGTIKGGESFVRCPHCDRPAHFSHLVEWLKVKSQCPNCREKISSSMFKSS